jgi:hypothetical protein
VGRGEGNETEWKKHGEGGEGKGREVDGSECAPNTEHKSSPMSHATTLGARVVSSAEFLPSNSPAAVSLTVEGQLRLKVE